MAGRGEGGGDSTGLRVKVGLSIELYTCTDYRQNDCKVIMLNDLQTGVTPNVQIVR